MQSSISVGTQWCSDGQLQPGQWYVSHAVCHIACIDLRKTMIFWIQELIPYCVSGRGREKGEEKPKGTNIGSLASMSKYGDPWKQLLGKIQELSFASEGAIFIA